VTFFDLVEGTCQVWEANYDAESKGGGGYGGIAFKRILRKQEMSQKSRKQRTAAGGCWLEASQQKKQY